MPSLRIALCQLDVTVGDLEGNVRMIRRALDEAEADGADIAVFPELAITGYPPEDLLLEPSFIDAAQRAAQEVIASTKSCVAVFGFVERDTALYNAAAIASNGRLHGVWHKELLPNYGVFDEGRWFAAGNGMTPLFVIGGVRVGVTICEDAWLPAGPIARLAAEGAELILSINASPYRRDVIVERQEMLASRARESDCSLVYVNLIGGQDELIFDGGSMMFDRFGSLVARTPQFVEVSQSVDINIEAKTAPVDSSGLPDVVISTVRRAQLSDDHSPTRALLLDRVSEVYDALVLATRDYVEKNGFHEVAVGLSGGIDSALVAALATDALTPERVHGVAMPSRYSSDGSFNDAQQLANNLGIDFRVISIEPAYRAFLEMLAPSFAGYAPNLAEENVQARVRGTLMMGLSNKLNWLVLTTGNKSETAVGYSTLYGDMAGGFAVIKDVPKLLVYELCELKNKREGTDIIPKPILDKPPSAELRPDQRDDDTLPPYALLDPILEGYIEYDKSLDDLVAEGFDAGTVTRVLDLVDGAEYKRRQAAPGPRVTHRAFGKDRRMPIVNRFRSSAPWSRSSP